MKRKMFDVEFDGYVWTCLSVLESENGNLYYLIYSDDALEDEYYASTATIQTSEDNEFIIMVNEEFIMCFPETVKKAVIYHEVGHVEDPRAYGFNTYSSHEEYINDRNAYVKNGDIMPIELYADYFMFNSLTADEVFEYIEYREKYINTFIDFINEYSDNFTQEEFEDHELCFLEMRARVECIKHWLEDYKMEENKGGI